MNLIIDEFVSRECRTEKHDHCSGMWYGLGFKVTCSCKCNHYKKTGLEQQVVEPACSNTSNRDQPIQQQVVLLDD